MSILKTYGCYFIGLSIISFFVWVPRSMQVNGRDSWAEWFAALWVVFASPGYVLGVIFIIFPGIMGGKDFVSKFMSSSLFQFLAKLTFAGYLIHAQIILSKAYSVRSYVYIA